jgi:hypothetical protein
VEITRNRRGGRCTATFLPPFAAQLNEMAGGGGSEATHKSGNEITKGRMVTEARTPVTLRKNEGIESKEEKKNPIWPFGLNNCFIRILVDRKVSSIC